MRTREYVFLKNSEVLFRGMGVKRVIELRTVEDMKGGKGQNTRKKW